MVTQRIVLALAVSAAVGCNSETPSIGGTGAGAAGGEGGAAETEGEDGNSGHGPDDGGGEDGSGGGDDPDVPPDPDLPPSNCTEGEFDYDLLVSHPHTMLVLDQSGSMFVNTWDHDGDDATAEVTRWWSLFHVVEGVLGRFQDSMEFGVALFPASWSRNEPDYDVACPVAETAEVPVAEGSSEACLAALPPADAMRGGGSPARGALQNAIRALEALDDGTPRSIVLVTDGAANCRPEERGEAISRVYDDDVEELVGAIHDDLGVPVYVVGVAIEDDEDDWPQVNPHEALTELARRGGASRLGPMPYYNTHDEGELSDAIAGISAQIECSVPLSIPAYTDTTVDVVLDGEPLNPVTDCATERGWIFASETEPFQTLVLCGDACSATMGGALKVALRCR